jgi:GH24 family phage-related lysozyme (muramidase)
MGQVLDSLQKLLAFDEGKKLKPYQDRRGIWTIGIGHNLEAHGIPAGVIPQLKNGSCAYPACMEYLQANGITEQQCQAIFAGDIYNETAFLNGYQWYLGLDHVRMAAVDDMAFNLGETKFKTFTDFQRFLNADDFAGAAADLRNGPPHGIYHQLPERYERLCKMLETGEWPVV